MLILREGEAERPSFVHHTANLEADWETRGGHPASSKSKDHPGTESSSGHVRSTEHRVNGETEKLIIEALKAAEAGFMDLERKNTEVIGRIEGEDRFQTLALVAEPSAEQVQQYYQILQAAFAALPASANALNRVADAKVDLINRYLKFDAPYKLINYIVTDPEGTPGQASPIITTIETTIPNRDAVVIDGTRLILKDSVAQQKLGPEAATRYAHVLDLEPAIAAP